MKISYIGLICAACISSASATTIIAAGGLEGYQFGFTTTGQSAGLIPFAKTGESVATFAFGSITDNLFTVFAPLDITPPSIGSSSLLAGKWSGNSSDDSSAADAFNNSQIWVRISTTIDGQTYTGYFADLGLLFPENDGGIDDSRNVLSYNLDAVSSLSSGTWVIDAANQQVRLAIPEPSVTLLGVLGMLGFLRRKR